MIVFTPAYAGYAGTKCQRRATRVCPSLSEVEDVPLRTFSKLAFYWSASATTKLIILESIRKLTGALMGGKAAAGATKLDRTMTWR